MYTLEGLINNKGGTMTEINGKWVRARPINYQFWEVRWRDAWAVLTGRADAFTWPEGQ